MPAVVLDTQFLLQSNPKMKVPQNSIRWRRFHPAQAKCQAHQRNRRNHPARKCPAQFRFGVFVFVLVSILLYMITIVHVEASSKYASTQVYIRL